MRSRCCAAPLELDVFGHANPGLALLAPGLRYAATSWLRKALVIGQRRFRMVKNCDCDR